MNKLEAAIAANVDDTDAYLVYGDWLQGQGDPRGELIALQHARTAKAKKAEAELLAKHASLFLLEDVVVEWHLGFWKSARIVDDTKAVLRKLARHPSAKLLRHLSFGRTHGRRQVQYEPIIKQLVKQRWPHLRGLDFGDFPDEDWQVEWSYVGNITPLYKAFPKLERLRLYGNRVELGTMQHANLRELAIRTDVPIAPVIAALGRAKLPKLERLALDLGQDNVAMGGLFNGRVPSLVHLALSWIELSHDDLVALLTGRTLAKLRTLALPGSSITDARVDLLVEHAARLKHLEFLDLENNLLSKEGKQRVAKLVKKVRC